MFVLDSDLLIGLIRNNPDAAAFFRQHRDAEFATTVVSVCELFEGAYRSNDPVSQLNHVQRILDSLVVLPVAVDDSHRFGRLAASLGQQGRILDDFDLLIAAIALRQDCVLVTRNRKHFERVPGLKIQIW